ncbi:efflux transporter outer membrane subunit [Lichenifustis flavocetrariae]|uniref:Efflux transporter outer membrane subunit n=1 Tax=Lichenifustis flavocetrariae TaxID=2949735 RepID=A0AA41Z470_9HYPH|nr:efflux transporter outer membrane subunit [Lichenifustis flavocetrariae]MCW6508922.1 efflux transporter outer membrane subunit [Lichenifustis flavocetrariae]
MMKSFRSMRSWRASTALLGLAILGPALPGCTVGPDFVAPLPQMAESRTFLDTGTPVRTPLPVLKGTTSAPPDVDWWRVFRDPILTRLEARVADQNLDVRTATFRLAESRAQLGTAAAAALPTVNGVANIYRQQYSQNGIVSKVTDSGAVPASLTQGLGTPFESYTAGFDASWELDLWGRVRRSVEAAGAEVDASAEARRDTLVSNLAELARDYVQLRGTQDMIRIARANIKVNQEILDVVRTRQQRGLVTGLDTSSAAQQVEAIQAQLPQLQQQEIQQINAISLLLGQPPLALSQELIADRAVPPSPPRVPIGVPSDLLRRRPDIRRAEAELHAAVAQIGVAVAQFFPTVTITGSPQFNALDPGNVFKASSLQYMNVGPSVSIPIFEGGRLKSNLVLQEARQQEAAVTYQKAVLQAWHDVVNALASLKGDQGRRALLQRQVADAQQALSLARSRYTQGVDNFTTVLQNSQTLLQAQTNLSQATTGISTDLVALYKALGGGWENAFPEGGKSLPPLQPTDALFVPQLPSANPQAPSVN